MEHVTVLEHIRGSAGDVMDLADLSYRLNRASPVREPARNSVSLAAGVTVRGTSSQPSPNSVLGATARAASLIVARNAIVVDRLLSLVRNAVVQAGTSSRGD